MPSFGFKILPLHGTVVLINTALDPHGTSFPTGTGNITRFGSALWIKKSVLKALFTARQQATRTMLNDLAFLEAKRQVPPDELINSMLASNPQAIEKPFTFDIPMDYTAYKVYKDMAVDPDTGDVLLDGRM
jgi:hypothetical protein